ncbi:hypothetical protein GTA08_BOTSDO03660 [Neofusicoccum parvum]|uniref:Uncharacterized protein n=2 Tax=Neofusicoccum parvum TaxID=310453 RepID=A0ACB5S0D2_9PEZI|nr:putative signaling mucin msb2 protein [Neofusicoccum parvum UCRNP2]GME26229.1 hypothetical protein GTA08_BOTSDO03660 [Neofusicoccum parvum]GME59079.1 hypothetical protein GTA08_BOTSDO03660 [Neofusicoccum parvum]
MSTTSTTPVFSIVPTGTDSATTYTVATSIVFDPSTAEGTSSTSATATATSYPKFIAPPGGMPTAPANTTKIQIGFKRGFNWPFVVGHADTTGWQLTTYMPIAVADGLGIDHDNVQMVTLTSYNTTEKLGYISTLAMMYVPSDLVDTLHLDLLNSNSVFYNNDDKEIGSTINFLTSFVDPTFPILASDMPDDGSTGSSTGSGSSSSSSGNANSGDPMGDGSNSSSPVKASAVGIAFAAIGGVAVYGAAMMLVARRYKKKKASHQRSSSVPSTGSGPGGYGSMNGGPFMTGGRGGRDSHGSRGSGSSNGRSARTAQISAPVMAENSLGWN